MGAALNADMNKCSRRARVILSGDMNVDCAAVHIREVWAEDIGIDRSAALLHMILDCNLRCPSSWPHEYKDRQWTYCAPSGRERMFDQFYSNGRAVRLPQGEWRSDH